MPPRKKRSSKARSARAAAAPREPSGAQSSSRGRGSQPRTASGKRASTQLLAIASLDAQEGLRERTEAGHLAAGRTPPSQESTARRSGAVKKVDDDIRTFTQPVTEDEKLLSGPSQDPA